MGIKNLNSISWKDPRDRSMRPSAVTSSTRSVLLHGLKNVVRVPLLCRKRKSKMNELPILGKQFICMTLICVVCFDKVANVCAPKCGHVFHAKCVDTWCKLNPSNSVIKCPVCNESIPLTPGVMASAKDLIDHALTKLESIADVMRNKLISELRGFEPFNLNMVEENIDPVYDSVLDIKDVLTTLGTEFCKRPTVAPLVNRVVILEDLMDVIEKTLQTIREDLIYQIFKSEYPDF